MSTASASKALCDTPGCGEPSSLRCPTCVKANIKDGSNFCSQVLDKKKTFFNLKMCFYF